MSGCTAWLAVSVPVAVLAAVCQLSQATGFYNAHSCSGFIHPRYYIALCASFSFHRSRCERNSVSMRIAKAIRTVLFTVITIIPTLIQYAILCIFLYVLI